MPWSIPTEMSPKEKKIASKLTRNGRFYVFLREVLPQLFDESFLSEMEKAYAPRGQMPHSPALLATVTLLQAYEQASDADAVLNAELDLRWQLVLGTMGSEKAPFSQGTLPDFRARMIEHELDKKLLDRTVELAKKTGKFGWQHLKAALDSSPLLGAGRVMDTWNLLGGAMRVLVTCAAAALGLSFEELCAKAKLTLISGKSLKAELDLDWSDEQERTEGLERLLEEAFRLLMFVEKQLGEKASKPPVSEAIQTLKQVLGQDFEPGPKKRGVKLKRGVAKNRRPSLGDGEMRHGRKSHSKKFVGYKRHIATILGAKLIAGAKALPANVAEHEAAEELIGDVSRHGELSSLHIDRGYLASAETGKMEASGGRVVSRAWPMRNGGRFTKEDFDIQLEAQEVECPAGEKARIVKGKATFDAERCTTCPLRKQCVKGTEAVSRTVSIHAQEGLLIRLRAEQKTAEGRKELRQRVEVEHRLARVEQIQGPRARYVGTRKNTLDLRRCASVINLQEIDRRTRENTMAA